MPMVTSLRTAGFAALALGLAGCSANGGSLELAADDVAVCAPRTAEGTTYIGMPLDNAGDDPVTLTGVDWSGDMVEDVEFLVDLEAEQHDQMVGTMAWPTDDPWGHEDEVLARAIPVEGAVIPAGVTADLLIAISPASDTDDAVVEETRVSYVEGLGYTATSRMTMTITAETGCAAP